MKERHFDEDQYLEELYPDDTDELDQYQDKDCKRTWDIYAHISNVPLSFVHLKSFESSWADMHNTFKKVADMLDFSVYHQDTTLVGYYYSKQNSWDCLVCLPDSLSPYSIYR